MGKRMSKIVTVSFDLGRYGTGIPKGDHATGEALAAGGKKV